ncbi:MAG: hypothetical protein C5B50_29515 [Verrucomicrobia bacterium]|nr:MAG: hypothetical protein C5B50_29515 [Verrucomicrobiota bacterium]
MGKTFRRYEILVPTKNQDGQPVEEAKFETIAKDLASELAGAKVFLANTGYRREESHALIYADVEDSSDTKELFVRYKQRLKERFDQKDPWVISYEVRVM